MPAKKTAKFDPENPVPIADRTYLMDKVWLRTIDLLLEDARNIRSIELNSKEYEAVVKTVARMRGVTAKQLKIENDHYREAGLFSSDPEEVAYYQKVTDEIVERSRGQSAA